MAITVTATQGGAPADGMLLQVVVLTGASISQPGATGTQSAIAAHTVDLDTTEPGSVVWSVEFNGDAAASDTNAGNTVYSDLLDTTNACLYATYYSAATATPGAFAAGSGDSYNGGLAAMEVLPAVSGTAPAVDSSTPAAATTETAETVTTAEFTPPSGALLLALVSANGVPGYDDPAQETMTVSGGGLTWVEGPQANVAGEQYAGIWYAFNGSAPPASFDILPVATTFPDTFLDLRAEIEVNGTWTDISSYLQRDPVVITRGHQDESTETSASQATFTLNNNDGRFSSHNPNGAYYPYIGRNTPVRLSLPEGASYLRLENDNVSAAQTSSAKATAAITGSIDIQIDVTPDNWLGHAILASKWNGTSSGSGTGQSWMIALQGSNVGFYWSNSDDSYNVVDVPIAPAGFPVSGRGCLRVTLDTSTGAVTFYSAPGGSLDSASWMKFGSATGPEGDIQDPGTEPIILGYNANTFFQYYDDNIYYTPAATNYNGYLGALMQSWGFWGITGKIHAFRLLDGIGGTVAAEPDFTQATAGATSFEDALDNTWTMEGTAEISDRKFRFHGEMSAWPQSWGPPGQEILVSVTAAGYLRRYSQEQIPEESPMYRGYTVDAFVPMPVAYWPMEDGTASPWIASALTGGAPMTFTGSPELSSNTDFACSAAIPVLNGAIFTGDVPIAAQDNPTTCVLQFILSVPSGGDTASGAVAQMFFQTGTVNHVVVAVQTSGTLLFEGTDNVGDTLFTTGDVAYEMNGTPALVAMVLEQSGDDIEYTLAVQKLIGPDGVAPAGGGTTTGSFAGTLGPVSRVQVNPSATLTTSAVGHVAVQNDWDGYYYFGGILNAWQNEYAAARFQRLCLEEGLQCRVIGDLTTTCQMGVQSAETITELLQECVDADFGVWVEPRQCLGWGYACQSAIGNQMPGVTGDYNEEFLDGDLQPTEDDQTSVNDISVIQEFGPTETVTGQQTDEDDTGSSARATLLTGSMSIQLPPNGIGRYQNEVEINLLFPQALALLANQMLRTGSTSEPRYPGITINLATNFGYLQSMFYDILDLDISQRLVIANSPYWLPPGQIDQLIQGMTETLWLKQIEITYNGWPMEPWNVVVFNDDTYGFFDTAGSELAGSYDAGMAPGVWQFTDGTVEGWTGSTEYDYATVAASSVYAPLPGTAYPLVITNTGGGTFWQGVSPAQACAEGDVVAAQATVYFPQAVSDAFLTVSWYNSDGDYLSSSEASTQAVAEGETVVLFLPPATAPADAVSFGMTVSDSEEGTAGWEMWVLSAMAAVQETISVETTDGPIWTTESVNFPFNIMCFGEEMAVNDITGSTSPQLFTVTRAVNGVIVALAEGTSLNVYPSPYFGL